MEKTISTSDGRFQAAVFFVDRLQAHKQKHFSRADIDEEVPSSVITDESRLKQILINLIGNAVKFTSTGGITVEVCQDEQDEKCLQISVVDTGIGIKEEDQGKLFQMYGRVDEERNINKNGVGLGLVISNVLAGILGRRDNEKGIEVKSQYGVGSRFYFKIRKDLQNLTGEDYKERTSSKEKLIQNLDEPGDLEYDEFAISSTPMEGDNSPLSGKFPMSKNLHIKLSNYSSAKKLNYQRMSSKHSINRTQLTDMKNDSQLGNYASYIEIKEKYILVVDDNPFNLLVLSNMIKDMDIYLKTASSGQEAIEIVKTCASNGETIKVILMDCHMPVMDGYETSSILKRMMENGEVPTTTILALTAGISEQDMVKAKQCGMQSCLSKPLAKETLLKELDKL